MQVQIEKQAVTQQQSQALIHELISVSINCITFLRNIFNDDNYIDTKYYGDREIKSNYIRTKKLIPGVTELGNQMIKYIEEGVKDAIEKSYLKAIQFTIKTPKNDEFTVAESYVFGIDYKTNQVTLSNGFSQDSNFSTKILDHDEIICQIQNMIRKLILLTQSFDLLSKKKEISIKLLFNNTCPKDYQPPHFHDASDLPPTTIKINDDGNSNDLGLISTGRHNVQLNVFVESREEENNENSRLFDPFDIFDTDVDGDIDFDQAKPLEDIPASSLRLDSYLNSNMDQDTGITQYLSKSANVTTASSFGCKKCFKELNHIEYGYIIPARKSIICYDCLFPDGNRNVQLLIKIRILWNYLLNNEFPNDFLKVLNLSLNNDQQLIKTIFNWFFKYSILMTVNRAQIEVDSSSYVKGCGTFTPMIDGIIDQNGSILKKELMYFIAFIPVLKERKPFYNYDSNIDQLVFPNYKYPQLNYIKSQLNKIESQTREIRPRSNTIIPDSQPSYGTIFPIVENRMKTIAEITECSDESDENEITKVVDNSINLPMEKLSFADSLEYLSQGTLKEDENIFKKRKIDEPICEESGGKRRKISANN
ncbi:hypothetical protein KGF54_001217 [Candida jiufengensis]|uniref:uncharacterized protein n=1 Tax=Candida jiufengensis TaxID=497108 RepID=UPI002225296E|nr:uncharacterized protein KGF54_001217 [Candida jiufengensis]KAI5955715.1 hypothetical protein KGF54_001217 [Candida jiufengensis]